MERIAAVLVPVYRDEDGRLRLVLIVRTDRGLHGGQLALPGGKVDADDETLMATALREAEEEIGLDPAKVQVLAELDSVRSGPTDYQVHPFLARVPADARWQLNPDEVAEVLTPRSRSSGTRRSGASCCSPRRAGRRVSSSTASRSATTCSGA